MKLERKEAQTQAKRLQSCPMLAPQTDDGRKEIVDCLMRHCQSVEHAVAVMTQVLDDALEVKGPITAWIASIARRTQHAEVAPDGCWRCEIGPDVETGEMRWAVHVPTEWKGYTCAGRCSCVRGRWLAGKDQERRRESRGGDETRSTGMSTADDWAMRAAGDLQ